MLKDRQGEGEGYSFRLDQTQVMSGFVDNNEENRSHSEYSGRFWKFLIRQCCEQHGSA